MGAYIRLWSYTECDNGRFGSRLCENTNSENPSGKLPPIYYILKLENGFQWSVQVLTRPVMQRYPTCEKIQIVFTQPRPFAAIAMLKFAASGFHNQSLIIEIVSNLS
jgi:hypothetical protein